jgi:glycosyltransferase involved in cell wall biosynthesis
VIGLSVRLLAAELFVVNTHTEVNAHRPLVSIILPTHNRAKFLPQALASIQSQTFTGWELIVVDDGSTDNTADLVPELTAGWHQRVRYHWQENHGAYAARNVGLDMVDGEFVAFFDSDDVWLPHHLADCVRALVTHAKVDWVWGASRIIQSATGEVVQPNTFHPDGLPRQFLQLRTKPDDRLQIIDDPDALLCMVRHGFYAGLQNSVIRRTVFANRRFATEERNGEDVILVLVALVGGHQFAYYDAVHVLYTVHEGNSSVPRGGRGSVAKQRKVLTAVLQRLEVVGMQLLVGRERRALKRVLAQRYFWTVGYAVLWQNGLRRDAMSYFQKALRMSPWNWAFWKTYVAARLRLLFGGEKSSLSQAD